MRYYLRKAKEQDSELIYHWANDDDVRKNSFQSEKIVWENHQKWFVKKLSSGQCDIFIYCVDDIPVGQIRLEYEKDRATISYSIEKKFRGQGHGRNMLRLAEQKVAEDRDDIVYLDAEVKKSNIASCKKFEQLGYECMEIKRYSKKIEKAGTGELAATEEINTRGGGIRPFY